MFERKHLEAIAMVVRQQRQSTEYYFCAEETTLHHKLLAIDELAEDLAKMLACHNPYHQEMFLDACEIPK